MSEPLINRGVCSPVILGVRPLSFMKQVKLLLIIAALLSLSLSAPAQNRKKPYYEKNVRISKEQPTVYIEYIRAGKLAPLGAGESAQRVWLRLRNNSRWELYFTVNGVPKEYGDVSFQYDVEIAQVLVAVGEDSPPKAKDAAIVSQAEGSVECSPPFKYGERSGSVITLRPGKSLVFSVPREYLCENRRITIPYSYEWEQESSVSQVGEPEHGVVFYGSQIPKGAR